MAMTVRKATCLAAALGALLAVVPAADASTVRITNGQLRYVGAGEANRVQVARGPGGEYSVLDPSVRVRLAAGCASTGRNTATCTGDVTRVTVVGAGGADRLSATFLEGPGTLDGGDGNDVLTGGGGDDILDGDDGTDTLTGLGGRDELRGDDDADRLDGGPGPDIVDGGRAVDTADYSNAPAAVSVDLDGNADDGTSNEGDRVEADVDRIVGSPFDDRIVAVSGNHTFEGGAGNDTLLGGSGVDHLDGQAGDDRLNGGGRGDGLGGGGGNATAG